MSAYKAGQRVRIEWPDGSAVEGAISAGDFELVRYAKGHYSDIAVAERDGATVTILAEPRPDEPTGLGAVVEAATTFRSIPKTVSSRQAWVRHPDSDGVTDDDGPVWSASGMDPRKWADLIDPVVLHEGWRP